MASIKQLKDDINYLTYDLINECFTYKMNHPDRDGKVDKAIQEIVRVRNELIHRVNNPDTSEGAPKLRAQFNKVKADLGKLVKLVEDISKEA